jgi:hypothetical protein
LVTFSVTLFSQHAGKNPILVNKSEISALNAAAYRLGCGMEKSGFGGNIGLKQSLFALGVFRVLFSNYAIILKVSVLTVNCS